MTEPLKILIVDEFDSSSLVKLLLNNVEKEYGLNTDITIGMIDYSERWVTPLKTGKVVRPFQDLHSRPYGKNFRRIPFK